MESTSAPTEKAYRELTEATANLNRYIQLVADGQVANPSEITSTSVFRALKDAMNQMEFIVRSRAMDETANIATTLVVPA